MLDLVLYLLKQTKTHPRPLRCSDMPFLLNTRLAGIVKVYIDSGRLSASNDLSRQLSNLADLALIHNQTLFSEALLINSWLQHRYLDYCWIKGVRDIYLDPDELRWRKMADCDVLTKSPEDVRSALIERGFQHGTFSRSGAWMKASDEVVREHEVGHYELFPLTKQIVVPYRKVPGDPILQQRYRLFRTRGGFFTDLTVDIHHTLYPDLKWNWMTYDGDFFPHMRPIDDVWYSMFKSYYEVIRGLSINIQGLILTVNKMRRLSDKRRRIAKRMAMTGFFNEELWKEMWDICNGKMSVMVKERISQKLVTAE